MLLKTVRSRNFDTLLAERFNAESNFFQPFRLELLKSIGESDATNDRKETARQRELRPD
jgi:hypothetical protein